MGRGIILDGNNDLKIRNGSVVIGETTMQDAYVVLKINQGELKDDPMTGMNLTRMIRGKVKMEKIRKTIEIALKRVGVRLDDIKDKIGTFINNQEQE